MDFYKRVAVVCERIPSGKVATYGQVALLCGFPKNSRQVGYALRCKKAGDVPAFRIVNHKGVLSGALAFEMVGMQRKLLEHEGIHVDVEDNRVNLKRYGWKNTMQEALELKKAFEKLNI